MANENYLDLFVKAQKNQKAIYHIVTFNLANSSSLSDDELMFLGSNIRIIVKSVYKKLLDKESELKRQVMIKDKRFVKPWIPNIEEYDRNFIDPLINQNGFTFTVIKGTVKKSELIEWVNECIKLLNMRFEFNVLDAYYETNESDESLLSRGNCLQVLDNYHRPCIQRRLKRIQNKQDSKKE